jgi:Transposase, Mutator family
LARPRQPGRNTEARSLRWLKRFRHVINSDEVFGTHKSEGAKLRLTVVNELRARGVNDILIAVVGGLKGFPEAITSLFLQTVVQICIVQIRNSLAFGSLKGRWCAAASG